MRLVGACFALLLLLASSAAAKENPTVLVLPFEAPGQEATIGAAATDLVAEALAAGGGVRLVDREDLDRVLAEQHVALASGAPDAARVGRLLAADFAVTGTVSVSATWRFTLNVLRLPEGSSLAAPEIEEAVADLPRAAQRAAAAIRAALHLPSVPLRSADHDAAAASLHYLRGLGFERAGLFVEAIGEFLEARRLSVRFPETQFWMGRAYLRAGEAAHARICLDAFLVKAPEDHPLQRDAFRLREEAARSGSGAPASKARSLAGVLLSYAPPEERRRAVDEAVTRGDPHELEAAALLPHESDLAGRILLALADLDADRFVRVVTREPVVLDAAGVRVRFTREFTAPRATAFARGLLSPRMAERAPVVRFFMEGFPGWSRSIPKPVAEAVEAVVREGAASEDEAVSHDALSLPIEDSQRVEPIVGRIRDASYSARYRADLLGLCRSFVASDKATRDALIEMMGDPNDVLRDAARRTVSQGGDAAFQERVGRRAAELLASRRYPDDAPHYAHLARGFPPSDALARTLLGSANGRERIAGLTVLRFSDPAAAAREGWALLEDAEPSVVQTALAAVPLDGDPIATAERLHAWWAQGRARTGEAGEVFRMSLQSFAAFAFQALGRRILPASIWVAPAVDAGPDAHLAWIRELVKRAASIAGWKGRWEHATVEERAGLLEDAGAAGDYAFFALWDLARQRSPLPPVLREAYGRGVRALARRKGVPVEGRPSTRSGVDVETEIARDLMMLFREERLWLPKEDGGSGVQRGS